jgi:hypothetical protein
MTRDPPPWGNRMPANVYRIACSHCEYRSVRFPGDRLAVLVPDPLEDTADGTVLLHPLAPFVLEEFDLTFPRAAWGGHLVDAKAMVCTDCGKVFERQKLTGGGVGIGCGGWMFVFAMAAAVAGLTAYLSQNPFIGLGVAGLGAVGTLACLELGAGWIIRRRYPTRARSVARGGHCPNCGSENSHRAKRYAGTLPCPQCGQTACRVESG